MTQLQFATPGDAVKYIRRFACLSQEEFGKQVGIEATSVSFYECNQRTPRWDMLLKILHFARGLGIEITALDFNIPERKPRTYKRTIATKGIDLFVK